LMEIWLNGLYTFLFLTTMTGIYYRSKSGIGSKWIVSSVTIFMWILSTVHMIMRWVLVRNGFVFNVATPTTLIGALSKPGLWWISISSTVFSANTLVADCLFMWRCWIIWGRNWKVVLPSAILTLVGTVFSVLADVAQITNIAGIEKNLASNSLFINTGTIYLALSFSTTILITILIAYRILKVDSETKRALGKELEVSARVKYTNVIEIVVESAALYSLAEMILLILLVRADPNLRYAQNMVAQITGIAPTLIVLRITFGLARPASTWIRSDPIQFASGTEDTRTTLGGSRGGNDKGSETDGMAKYPSRDSEVGLDGPSN